MARPLVAPTDLPNCILWLDASDSASVIRDGSNLVSQWSDKSGNANDATESNPLKQPSYNATGFDGLPCVDWGNDGTVRRLNTGNVNYDQHTIFLVLRIIGGTFVYVHDGQANANREYILTGAGGPHINVRRAAGGQSGKNITPLSASFTATTLLHDSQRHIVTKSYGGLHWNHRFRIDAAEQQAATVSTLSANPTAALNNAPLYFGAEDTSVAGIRGVIAEIILFSRALSEGEIAMVEQYLARKWRVATYVTRAIASPLELSDCAMWFDASQGITLDGSNNVSQWDDSSGNARHIAQAAANQRPGYSLSNPLFGGKATVDWTTVGGSIYLERGSADNLSQPLTVITCGLCSNTGATNIGYFVNASGSDFSFQRLNASIWQFFNGGGVTVPFAPPDVNEPFVITCAAVPTVRDSIVNLNRARMGRGGGGTAQMTTLRLGSMYNGFQSSNWNGSIAEFIVYRRRLVEGEITAAETYLQRKYAA
jgi:hypothetical protein